MKVCPYCAEEIQDRAIICRFCNRRVDGSRYRAAAAFVAAAALLVMVGIAAFRLGQSASPATATTTTETLDTLPLGPTAPEPGVRPPPPPPLILNLFEPRINLAAREKVDTTFTLPARPCFLSGRITGVNGGNRDIRVLVLDEDGYANWENGLRPNALFDSGRSSATTLDVELPTPGSFSVVISNEFSFMTRKVVETERILVSCGSR